MPLGAVKAEERCWNGTLGRRTRVLLHARPLLGWGPQEWDPAPQALLGMLPCFWDDWSRSSRRDGELSRVCYNTKAEEKSFSKVREGLKMFAQVREQPQRLEDQMASSDYTSWVAWGQEHHQSTHKSNDAHGQRARGGEAGYGNAEPRLLLTNVSEGRVYLSYWLLHTGF